MVAIQSVLTPLIDVLIALLFFLMLQFNASGEVCGCRPFLNLAHAEHTELLTIAPIVQIGPELVTMDGRRMARTDEVDDVHPLGSLADDLETLRRNWAVLHANEPFTGSVLLEVDRSIPFERVRPVLRKLAAAGYDSVQLVVIAPER